MHDHKAEKASFVPTVAKAESAGVQTRAFEVPTPQSDAGSTLSADEAAADIQAKLSHAARFGHDLIQPMVESAMEPTVPPTVQRQEEEEGEAVEEDKKKEPEEETPIQTKLTMGQPGDKYEKEADDMARRVMKMPEPQQEEEDIAAESVSAKQISPKQISPKVFNKAIQAKESGIKGTQIKNNFANIQAKGSRAGIPAGFEQQLASKRGGGQPLSGDTREFMESRFGADFSGVRVHQEPKLTTAVQAQAFTHGQDIYFNSGKYNPGSNGGKELLAHELTHTIQQTGGKVRRKTNKEQVNIVQGSETDSLLDTKQLGQNEIALTGRQLVNKGASAKALDNVVGLSNPQLKTEKLNKTTSGEKPQKQAVADNAEGEKKGAKPGSADKLSTLGKALQKPESETSKKENSSAQTKHFQGADTSNFVGGGLGAGLGNVALEGQGDAPKGSEAEPQSAMALNTEDPGQIIDQLKNTPATQLGATFAQAGTASAHALESQRNSLEELIPEVPAPTGLPAQGISNEATPKKAVGKTPKTSELTAPQAKGAGSVSAKDQIQIPELPSTPAPRPTRLAGNDTQPAEDQNDDALSRSAQNALSQVSTTATDVVSTQAGPPPTVDLSGDADPIQVDTAKAQSAQEVQAAKLQAQQEISQDFGENSIFPKASNETLKTNKELTKFVPSASEETEAISLPGEAVGGLNRSLSPYLQDKIGVEQEKYQTGKANFDTDSQQAQLNADQEMAQATEDTRQQQLQEQQAAQDEVTQQRQEWQAEIDKADQDYQDKAAKASTDQKQKIDTEKTKGEEEADQHLKDAEQKAEAEKQKADDQAAKEKQNAEKESGGFWGWAKSAAKSLVDGLKSAVNAIYNGLRSVVKGIFEAAKKLAVAAIDLARNAIVGLIKGFGEILKGLVNVVFAAFPEIANRINEKIDQAVQKAEAAVNAAADLLKKGITAILDLLANTLDSLLGLIQDLYNGIFTVLGMLITGELKELLSKFGNLIEAAKTVPDQFETAALEELLGGNLDESLSPAELSQAGAAGIEIPGREQVTTGENQAVNSSHNLPRPPWTAENVGVDAVEDGMELSPELVAELMQRTNGEGEVMLGESNDQSRSMESILSESGISSEQENAQQGAESQQATKHPPDGLTPKQRAEIKWELMKDGISKWWSDNWPLVIGGATAAFAVGTAAVILSGGSVLGLIPPIMSVLGPLFAGLTVIQLAGHARDYVSKSWNGEIQSGGKSLAKGLAAGAIELISWLTFKAGGAALKGAKVAAKGARAAAKGGMNLARKAAQAVIKGAKYVIRKGKVLFKGIAKSRIGKQFKKLKSFGKGLLERMRFKAFRIRVANRSFKLEGLINPWVIVANGRIREVPEGTEGAIKVSDEDLLKLKEPGEKVLTTRRGYEQARNTALEFLGDLGPDAQPLIGRLRTSAGHGKTIGFQSADGKLRLRLDFDPAKGPHFNLEDFRFGKGDQALKIAFPFEGNEKMFKSYLKLLKKWRVF